MAWRKEVYGKNKEEVIEGWQRGGQRRNERGICGRIRRIQGRRKNGRMKGRGGGRQTVREMKERTNKGRYSEDRMQKG